jgi:hypothetical protein
MMTVYYNETQYQKLTWCMVFVQLILYLKEKYNANVVYHKGTGLPTDGYLYIKELDLNLPDCELVIHNSDDDSYIGITWADNPGDIVNSFIRRNRKEDKLYVMQFTNRWPRNFDKSTYNFQILQGTHYPFLSHTNHDYFYYERKLHNDVLKDNFIDKMFFLGRDDRPAVWELRKLGLCNENMGTNGNVGYFDEMIKYKMGLAISGVGELCCRDIEYLAVGVPMIKIEYNTQLNPPLIPNFHFIAIDRDKNNLPWDSHNDLAGGPEIVEVFKQRFFEVKDDKEFLDFVAKNGREYYEQYSHPCNRMKHLTNILGL